MSKTTFIGAAVGLSKFIGPARLQAHRSCQAPNVEIRFCVPGQEKNFDANKVAALAMGFHDNCIFPTIGAMLEAKGNEIDFGVVNTPNHDHLPKCQAFAEADIPTICDKPLADNLSHAQTIYHAFDQKDLVNAITPTYCFMGANIEARHRVALAGKGSKVRGGVYLYPQHWLDQPVESIGPDAGGDQADWRKNPMLSGEAGALGDIWTHLAFLLWSHTGLKVKTILAERRWVVTGRRHDETDDEAFARVILENGARITVQAAQYAGANDNNLSWQLWLEDGERLSWSVEESEILWHCPAKSRILQKVTPSGYESPIISATNSMPGMHDGDGWAKAEQRILQSFLAQAFGVPAGLKPFHLTFKDGLNIQAMVHAAIASATHDEFGMKPTPVAWTD